MKRGDTCGAVVLVLLLIALCLPRVLALDADPPSFFAPGFIADEGWWVHNPRQAVLFGSWIMDDFNQSLIISPIFSVLVWSSFHVLGVSFMSARLPSALAGCMTLLLLILWSKSLVRQGHASTAMPWIIALLYGLDIFAIGFARVALVDTMMVLFMVATVYFWDRGTVLSAVWSGIMLCLAACVKPTAVFLSLVLVLTWLWERFVRRENLKRPLALGVTVLVGAGIWFGLMYPGGLEQFIDLNRRFSQDNLPASLVDGVRNSVSLVLTRRDGQVDLTRFAAQSPFLIVWAGCLLVGMVAAIRRTGFKSVMMAVRRWQVLLSLWAIIGTVLLMPNQYKPERRFLFLIAPLAMLTASVLADWLKAPSSGRPTRSENEETPHPPHTASERIPLILIGAGTLLPSIMAAVLVVKSCRIYLSAVAMRGNESVFLLVVIVCTWLLSGVLVRFILSKTNAQVLKRTIVFLTLAVTVLFHGTMIGLAVARTSFTLRDASRFIGRDLAAGQAVMGGLADTLCLENTAFSFAVFQAGGGKIYNGEPMVRFSPVNVLQLDELDGFRVPDTELDAFRNRLADRVPIDLLPRPDGTFRVLVSLYRVVKPTLSAENSP